MKECTRSIARRGGLAWLGEGIVRTQLTRHAGFVRVVEEKDTPRNEKEKYMKKIILGVILTAGAVLAQSTATAPASSGTKSATPATSAPAAKAPVKRHSKSNKPAAVATKPAAAKPATGASSGSSSKTPATPAPASK